MMTQHSEDDQQLVQFLKQHHSTPPQPHQDLEDRIMAAVQPSSSNDGDVRSQFRLLKRQLFPQPLWIGAAIAASVTFAFVGYRSMMPTQLTVAEERELEEFLAENWTQTMAADTSTDMFVLPTNSY
ncbi:MAG: hypothetical protein WBA77_20185 [Microcoleaceae cyanobacterium]